MRTIHKKIGRRVKKYSSHFTKYLYEKDTVFATLSVFVFIIVLGLIPINFYFLNPLKLALKDFDFNDITYSSLGKSKYAKIDSSVVIINISDADREGLAMIIDKVESYQPKVVGVDALFHTESDPYKDSLLRETISRYDNLVMASWLEFNDSHIEKENTGFFTDVIRKKGYVNLVGTDTGTRGGTVRFYSPFEKEDSHQYTSFTAALIREYDENSFKRLEKRGKPLETINYSRHTEQYQLVELDNLMTDAVDSSAIRGKIALLGYINLDENDIEDKKFTPMNKKVAGKTTPDMNGIVVHANIISMVLENNYIKKLPSWVNWLAAILICWLHMSFFVRYYLEDHIWFHLVAKIAQLVSAIFFAWIGMVLFDSFNVKLDMKLSLIVIVMAVDVIYFYEAFAVWLNKKFNYHTVFHQKHH